MKHSSTRAGRFGSGSAEQNLLNCYLNWDCRLSLNARRLYQATGHRYVHVHTSRYLYIVDYKICSATTFPLFIIMSCSINQRRCPWAWKIRRLYVHAVSCQENDWLQLKFPTRNIDKWLHNSEAKSPHVPVKTYQMATEPVSLDLLQGWRSLRPGGHVYESYNWLSTARMAAKFQSVNPVVLN